MNSFYTIFLLLVYATQNSKGLPEQGIKTLTATKEISRFSFVKTTYNQTKVKLKISCHSKDKDVILAVSWVLRYSSCANELVLIGNDQQRIGNYMTNGIRYQDENYSKFEFSRGSFKAKCETPTFLTKRLPVKQVIESSQDLVNSTADARGRRAAAAGSVTTTNTSAAAAHTSNSTIPQAVDDSFIAATWQDGPYAFFLDIQADKDFTAEVTIQMVGKHGFLSANEWPLLLFFGIMGLVYILYGVVWLLLLACNWRDLLRIQFWIGGVILLGMLEKAVFYAEYQSISSTGVSVRGAVIFAELVSCLKRMLARMLVIIVSLGFGIVKPRLGLTFHKVLCVGILYFILASIEGCLRSLKPKSDQSKELMLANVPLAIVDAAICWWIFSGLVQTTRTLRLRRNIVKLSLYRHFTNTLIFAVLASITYMAWSITQHKLKFCLTDWRELWVDDAFWHLLFSVLLLVIMILWRPSANNQRYAFSPLLDAEEEEEEEDTIMNDAFDGMKMRGAKPVTNGSPKQKEVKNKAEDDLKWVEDNIPTSVTDKALPSLLDSDEEIMTTKFEISKME